MPRREAACLRRRATTTTPARCSRRTGSSPARRARRAARLGDRIVQAAAARVLGADGVREAIPQLERLARDPAAEETARVQAAYALARLGVDEGHDLLRELAASTPRGGRRRCRLPPRWRRSATRPASRRAARPREPEPAHGDGRREAAARVCRPGRRPRRRLGAHTPAPGAARGGRGARAARRAPARAGGRDRGPSPRLARRIRLGRRYPAPRSRAVSSVGRAGDS